MRDIAYYLGIHPLGALTTVIATVVLYFTFVWVLRSWGQRILAGSSSLNLAVVTVVGAMVGRATMGKNPTLAGGLIALATLLVCEHLAGRVRRAVASGTRRAVAVMVAGEVDGDLLAQFGVDELSLWSALRSSGIGSAHDVALAVLEPNGQFSVLPIGRPIHESALVGVRRAEDVLERLTQAGLAVLRRDQGPGHG